MLDVQTEYFDLWLSREIELTRRRVGLIEVSHISEPIQQLLEKVTQKLDVSSDAIKHHSLAQTELLRFIAQLSPVIRALVKRNSLSMNSHKLADRIVSQIRADLEIALKIALLSIQNKKSNGAPMPAPVNKSNFALNSKAKRNLYSDTKIRQFFKARMLAAKSDDFPPTLKDDETLAKSEFPDIGRQQIRNCRNSVYPPSWVKRGPRKTIEQLKSAG